VCHESLRVSRFLRAVGDPSSTFRGSIATATASATGAAAEAAAAGLETSGSVGEGLYPTDMPAAIEVTNRGLLGGRTLASGSGKGIGGGRSSGGGGGGGGGSRYGDGGEREKAAERRAIADIFRTVDLDASGHVSQQEFLEVVSRRCESTTCHVSCRVPLLWRRCFVRTIEIVGGYG